MKQSNETEGQIYFSFMSGKQICPAVHSVVSGNGGCSAADSIPWATSLIIPI
jgi:hypothetical protein